MTADDRAPLLGGIEAGGTKFICALACDPATILAKRRIATTTPKETIGLATAFFREAAGGRPLAALGLASFGPVELDRRRPDWGHILATPKAGWSNVDLAGSFGRALEVPVAFDTDVNGAALGEHRYGAGRGLSDFAYVTVGTGIGGAILANHALVHGRRHPEIGHIRPRRHALDDFAGSCPFHSDCFEGLASGTAILERCGAPLHRLPRDHAMWAVEADYLAQLFALLVLATSPQRIIAGGGVMDADGLLASIGPKLANELADYPAGIGADIAAGGVVVPPQLGARAGVIGALVLAQSLCA